MPHLHAKIQCLMIGIAVAAAAARASGAEWTFDAEVLESGAPVGSVETAVPGPRRPDYPGFAVTNRAVRLAGGGARIEFPDPGTGSVLDFTNGDAITIEAWLKPDEIRRGENVYIIGKGRTDPKSPMPHNQNWALRLREMGGLACPSFLFATPADGAAVTWRRWTATSGLRHDERWHHVAVAYEFGKPESIRCVIDGKPVKGAWDMGGPSAEPPVVDDADVWVGSSMGGNPGSSYRGLLDEVSVRRTAVPEVELVARFVTTLPPPAEPSLAEVGTSPNAGNDSAATPKKPAKAEIPAQVDPPKIDWSRVASHRVTVEVCDDWGPTANEWPMTGLAATETHSAPAFALFRLPHRYVETGVRGSRSDPFLVRAYARVAFPEGIHRLLLRARGASVLFVDGGEVMRTPFPPPGSDDKPVKVQDDYLDLGGDFRFAPPGNRDAWCEFESDGGDHEIVLETVVGFVLGGKKRRRPELGETVVAWSPEGSDRWYLVAPGDERVSYSDAGWTAFESNEEARLAAVDAAARGRARDSKHAYWERRRAHAADWLRSTPEIALPDLPEGFPATNAIDRFLAAKIVAHRADAKAKPSGGVDFWETVHPVLEARCLECHQGGKPKGGLHLDARAGAIAGGEIEGPAVVPGKPEESPLLHRVRSTEDDRMPPKGGRLAASEIAILERWIAEGAVWPEFRDVPTELTPLADDLTFLRRVTLDTLGVVPSLEEIAAFRADASPDRRERLIDRLLADPRAADHGMGAWQDMLAENPNILNPTLNNSGPFRWWIHESLLDNKPLDLMVTELLHLGGGAADGGPAGFAIASQNDVPLAAKATVVTTAFLGVETKCARCHDSPSHTSKQEDVFGLAAMLATKGVKVPATSSVSLAKLTEGGRTPLIEVTLEPGSTVEPRWPFAAFVPEGVADTLAEDPADTRDRLAALVTAPENERFAQVMANRIWARLMGRGIVDQPWDWERSHISHPELLRWLGREVVRSGYDARSLAKLILSSHAYQRETDRALDRPSPLFTAPASRRLAAEQVVDAAFAAVGKTFRTERACLDIDSIREIDNSIDLGQPSRAWMLTSTSNERDRPSLALPRIQAVCDVLGAFGWRATRPDPLTDREAAANPLQPAILGNGTMGLWLTRLSADHAVTRLAVEAASPEAFVETLFLRVLTRPPRPDERARYVALLAPGFEDRRLAPPAATTPAPPRRPAYYVSWSNHLHADATVVRQAQEAESRRGDPPTPLLEDDWRRRAEDALWSLVNSPEFLFTP